MPHALAIADCRNLPESTKKPATTKQREEPTMAKLTYLHRNKIATASYLLGDGIDGQVMCLVAALA